MKHEIEPEEPTLLGKFRCPNNAFESQFKGISIGFACKEAYIIRWVRWALDNSSMCAIRIAALLVLKNATHVATGISTHSPILVASSADTITLQASSDGDALYHNLCSVSSTRRPFAITVLHSLITARVRSVSQGISSAEASQTVRSTKFRDWYVWRGYPN